MYDLQGSDPVADAREEIRAFRRRPLLVGGLILAFDVFAAWYMTGGSATGSVAQAEAAIRAQPAQSGVVTVSCTQNGQSLLARLRGLTAGDRGDHYPQPGPTTTYTCSGTLTTGQPGYWCVTFAPFNSSTGYSPRVSARAETQSCPS